MHSSFGPPASGTMPGGSVPFPDMAAPVFPQSSGAPGGGIGAAVGGSDFKTVQPLQYAPPPTSGFPSFTVTSKAPPIMNLPAMPRFSSVPYQSGPNMDSSSAAAASSSSSSSSSAGGVGVGVGVGGGSGYPNSNMNNMGFPSSSMPSMYNTSSGPATSSAPPSSSFDSHQHHQTPPAPFSSFPGSAPTLNAYQQQQQQQQQHQQQYQQQLSSNIGGVGMPPSSSSSAYTGPQNTYAGPQNAYGGNTNTNNAAGVSLQIPGGSPSPHLPTSSISSGSGSTGAMSSPAGGDAEARKVRQDATDAINTYSRVMQSAILLCIAGSALALFTMGAQSIYILFVLLTCAGAAQFMKVLVHWIMSHDAYHAEMKRVSDAIREGSEGYISTQYTAIAQFAAVSGTILAFTYLFKESPHEHLVGRPMFALSVGFAFVLGAACSAGAGYVGMWMSVRVNMRVAMAAAKHNYPDALLLCFRGGAVSAALSAGLCIVGITLLYLIAHAIFVQAMGMPMTDVPVMLAGYGFGAAFVALFMQLGGGIYTKGADVGADMCGKNEIGLPEDDCRNPAVIADLVGDNVGDCAGSMADVFESISSEIIGTMILAASLCTDAEIFEDSGNAYIFFPLVIHALDLLISGIGILSMRVRTARGAGRSGARGSSSSFSPLAFLGPLDPIARVADVLDGIQSIRSGPSPNATGRGMSASPTAHNNNNNNPSSPGPSGSSSSSSASGSGMNELESGVSNAETEALMANAPVAVDGDDDPIVPMKRGYMLCTIIAVISFVIATRVMLHTPKAPTAWLHFAACGVFGILTSYLLILITQYYTDYKHAPVRRIAAASLTGHGTNVIAGISVGLESCMLPALVICCSLIISYTLGSTSGLPATKAGIFGTAVCTMGMLSTAVYILSMNNFGPIADNAGGIVEMSEQPRSVRTITDRLDAVGNVTKAASKGYAVGGSALACFVLFQAFLDEISGVLKAPFSNINVARVECICAGIIGITMIFVFAGWSMESVGKTAQEVVWEVRRQLESRPGILNFSQKPDYAKCVAIVTKSSLREMRKPAIMALSTPILVGVIFRIIGDIRGERLLAVEVLATFMLFATLTGLLMAVFLDNAGGAWDNAKKYIESQGKKGSPEHKASVTGDTVGDPFKDTAGPSLHVIITTMSTTILVLGPLFIGAVATQVTP